LKVNDNDILEQQEKGLRPAEKHILIFARTHPDLPFCWREFAYKYAHGTIRNAFSRLAKSKLIELYCRSCDAYYILHRAGRKRTRIAVTLAHMVGKYNVKQLKINDYIKYLDSLGWDEVWKVHDVVLCFEIEELYEHLIKEGKLPVIESSKDIRFLVLDWQKTRRLTVILHRTGTVTCYLKCSVYPIEITPEGLADLSAILGKIHTRLEDALRVASEDKPKPVPDVSKWVVTQWHCGKDGKREISGKSFNITYKTWSGALVRIYLKRHGKKFRPRKEIIEQPRKPLPHAFSEKAVNEEKLQPKDVEEDSSC
jgi:hypothetical protein